jgi:predicted dehydrogenase
VHGSEGSVRFNFERLTELEVYLRDGSGLEGFKTVIATSKKHPEMDKFWPDQGGGFAWNHLFVVELKHFLDSIAKGELVDALSPSFRDGYMNSLLIDSIVESSRSERWVKIESRL